MSDDYLDDPEDAPCHVCWKPVHLQHDPPHDCGHVTCPEHEHHCEDQS